MKAPTGKLAFAYQTIATLEARIAELESRPPAPVALNTRMAATLQSLRTNANPALFAPGQLAEVDACLDKVKEMNR